MRTFDARARTSAETTAPPRPETRHQSRGSRVQTPYFPRSCRRSRIFSSTADDVVATVARASQRARTHADAEVRFARRRGTFHLPTVARGDLVSLPLPRAWCRRSHVCDERRRRGARSTRASHPSSRGHLHDGAYSRVDGRARRGRGRAPVRDLRALQRQAHPEADGLRATRIASSRTSAPRFVPSAATTPPTPSSCEAPTAPGPSTSPSPSRAPTSASSEPHRRQRCPRSRQDARPEPRAGGGPHEDAPRAAEGSSSRRRGRGEVTKKFRDGGKCRAVVATEAARRWFVGCVRRGSTAWWRLRRRRRGARRPRGWT